MKETCAVATDTVIADEIHIYECRLTESKICVDNTPRGLLLTERQELLCVVSVEPSF